MSREEDWFKSWFDTEYYHILYQHRDDNEAQFFIRKLVQKLQPPSNAHILDLACGRGRHAKFLSEMGFEVTGIDLSESSIAHARQWENECLHFEVGDMRQPFGENRFDYIFNLFTSFGYFETRDENLRALQNMHRALKPGGVLVLDFMNVNKVRLGLVEEEVRQTPEIEFHIERFIRNNRVIKQIAFEDDGRKYQYEEKVQLLDREEFKKLFSEAGFDSTDTFGDFELNTFDPCHCERLILFAQPE